MFIWSVTLYDSEIQFSEKKDENFRKFLNESVRTMLNIKLNNGKNIKYKTE